MVKHQFIPDYITAIVDGAAALTGLTCEAIRAEGSYSRYVAVITDGKQTIDYIMPYDYGLRLPEPARAGFMADELTALFNLKPVKPETVEAVEETTDEVDSEPKAPVKPRKRAK